MTGDDGTPLFVGRDVATAFGYSDARKAIRVHVDPEDKGVDEMATPGGVQRATFINESGLYSLILSSKLPQAKAFKRWVTSEVLPQILFFPIFPLFLFFLFFLFYIFTSHPH